MRIHGKSLSMLNRVSIILHPCAEVTAFRAWHQHADQGIVQGPRLSPEVSSNYCCLAMCRWPCACCRPQYGRHGCKGGLDSEGGSVWYSIFASQILCSYNELDEMSIDRWVYINYWNYYSTFTTVWWFFMIFLDVEGPGGQNMVHWFLFRNACPGDSNTTDRRETRALPLERIGETMQHACPDLCTQRNYTFSRSFPYRLMTYYYSRERGSRPLVTI